MAKSAAQAGLMDLRTLPGTPGATSLQSHLSDLSADRRVEKVHPSTSNTILAATRFVFAHVPNCKCAKMPVSSSVHPFEAFSSMRKIYDRTCDYFTVESWQYSLYPFHLF